MSRAPTSTVRALARRRRRDRSMSRSRIWVNLRAGSPLEFSRRNPHEFRQLMAREGELPFYIGAGVAPGEAGRFVETYAPIEICDEMRHAVRAHDRQGRIELSFS